MTCARGRGAALLPSALLSLLTCSQIADAGSTVVTLRQAAKLPPAPDAAAPQQSSESLPARQPVLQVDTHENGSFALSLDGTTWLRSREPRLHLNGTWQTLSLLRHEATVADIAVWQWSVTGPEGPAVWETSVSFDGRAAIFSQTFLADASDTAVTEGVLLSEWPAVVQATEQSLGYVMGAGMDGGSRAGKFVADDGGNASHHASWAGEQGGPLALFDSQLATLLVSPAAEFMSTMMSGGSGVGDLAVGVMGSVASVPTGHSVKTIMIAGRGIRDTFVAWGDRLMGMHGKSRTLPAHSTDPVVTHLGYSLTGCYQYNPCDCGQHEGNCKSTGPFATELNSMCHDYPGDKPKTSRCSCQACPAILTPPQNGSASDTNCSTMADTLLLLDKHIRRQLGLNFTSFLIDSFWYTMSSPHPHSLIDVLTI